MAPETANQKRKRGGSGNASRDGNEKDAPNTQLTLTKKGQLSEPSVSREEPTIDEDPRPKKRGKASKNEVPPKPQAEPEPEPELENSTQPQGKGKRKRGQPSGPQEDTSRHQGEAEHANEEEPQPKKRGRAARHTITKESEQTTGEVIEQEITKPKRGGRPRKAPQATTETEVGAEEADDENEGDSSLLRRSGRTRRSERDKNTQQGSEKNQASEPDNTQSKKRGPRRKLQEPGPKDAAEEEQSPPQPKKRRGRASKEDSTSAEAPAPETMPRKRGHPTSAADKPAPSIESKQPRRKQTFNDQEPPVEEFPGRRGARKSKDTPKKLKGPRRSPRGTSQQSPHSSSDSESSPPPYRHLTTRTRRVPLHTIEGKWEPLDAPSISSVMNLLHSASRPVLTRLTNLQRHKHATAALDTVGKRLHSKLARGLPFPPATTSARRGDELEFERTVAGIRALEAQLDPLLHSVELLRREKERAEGELAREYRYLARLGTNARAEAREKRERARKMHDLVPPSLDQEDRKDADTLGLLPPDRTAGRVFADLARVEGKSEEKEEELRALAGQVANHMESMRGNLLQIDGVVPEIERSRALLRAALQKQLDEKVLESVVLG
ncbi:CENP-Q, a CENPA-CAD centromere complex subunit-domain-containing protein [Camillea tinctor]|nr:CENP-Q, a CENPA-CAD centromere complex subunit-domain-containing protein [Camillea tinctor]